MRKAEYVLFRFPFYFVFLCVRLALQDALSVLIFVRMYVVAVGCGGCAFADEVELIMIAASGGLERRTRHVHIKGYVTPRCHRVQIILPFSKRERRLGFRPFVRYRVLKIAGVLCALAAPHSDDDVLNFSRQVFRSHV